jgi:tetratricopeptide (TPR) repeat protein
MATAHDGVAGVLGNQPHAAEGYVQRGLALAAQGRRDEALACYRQALGLRPGSAAACTDLGVALGQLGQADEAVVAFRQALRLDPSYAKAHHNLGVALAQQGRQDEAVAALREALRLKPDYAEACYNLGIALAQLGRRDEAIACYREAVRLRPDYPDALNNLGLALTETGRSGEAAVLLRQAVRLRPDLAEGHNNLGLALAELGHFDEAVGAYEQALRLRPGYADAHGNLGNTRMCQGLLEEAVACHGMALLLQADSAMAHWNRALAWLTQGDYARGWPEYEWRWKRKHVAPRPFRQPAWDGSALEGRTLLIYMEQGLGDMIQFVRYAPLAKARGGAVLVECPPELLSLFSTCPGIDRLVAEGQDLPPFDVQAPLLSLPALLGTTLATVPADVPYLSPPPERVERWRQRLEGLAGFKIGICWQGNPRHKWDRHRSFPLARIAPLAEVPGVQLVSLQKGAGAEQVTAAAFPVMDFGDELDGTGGAFLDTAALIRNLDLVISTDTAVAHAAGALGAPVWLALSTVVDWRWLRGRDDTPWYPTMRLFRQERQDEWGPVFQRMATELGRLVAQRSRLGAVTVPIAPGELLDKLTILRLKGARLRDEEKLRHIRTELAILEAARGGNLPTSEELARLEKALCTVNAALWDIEDELRRCERAADFGPRFIELARSVYRHNDERAALKRRINDRLGAAFAEQKAYG